jgi:hypothetical protein
MYLVSVELHVVIDIQACPYGTMITTNWNVYLQNDLSKGLQETFQRTSMVYEGIKGYVRFSGGKSNCMLHIQ